MSTPTPEILPYATPEGIKHYVQLEAYDASAKIVTGWSSL